MLGVGQLAFRQLDSTPIPKLVSCPESSFDIICLDHDKDYGQSEA